MRTYEGMFIFSDSLKDSALDEAVARAKAEMEKLGAVVHSTTKLGRRQFARALRKQEQGNYYLITFDLNPTDIDALRARYRLNEDVFRIQLIRQETREPEPAEAAAGAATDGD